MSSLRFNIDKHCAPPVFSYSLKIKMLTNLHPFPVSLEVATDYVEKASLENYFVLFLSTDCKGLLSFQHFPKALDTAYIFVREKCITPCSFPQHPGICITTK